MIQSLLSFLTPYAQEDNDGDDAEDKERPHNDEHYNKFSAP
jgi:hypothetical protein